MSTNRSGNLNQVMQQAVWDSATRVPEGDIRALKHRIHALEGEVIGYKQILDAQPVQEPVAWAMLHDNGQFIDAIHPDEHARFEGKYTHPLYTTPPQRTWTKLTDEEVGDLSDFAYTNDEEFVRNVEAKLKEQK